MKSPTSSIVYLAPARCNARNNSARISFADGRTRFASPERTFSPVRSSHSMRTLCVMTMGQVLPSRRISTFWTSLSAIFLAMGLNDRLRYVAGDLNVCGKVDLLVGFERPGLVLRDEAEARRRIHLRALVDGRNDLPRKDGLGLRESADVELAGVAGEVPGERDRTGLDQSGDHLLCCVWRLEVRRVNRRNREVGGLNARQLGHDGVVDRTRVVADSERCFVAGVRFGLHCVKL